MVKLNKDVISFLNANVIIISTSLIFSILYFPSFVFRLKVILFSIGYHLINVFALLIIWTFLFLLLLKRVKSSFFSFLLTAFHELFFLLSLITLYIGSAITQEHISETLSIPLLTEVLVNSKNFLKLALLMDPVIFIIGAICIFLLIGLIFFRTKQKELFYQQLITHQKQKIISLFTLGSGIILLFTLFIIPIPLDKKFDRTPIWFFEIPNQYDPIVGGIHDSYFGIESPPDYKLNKSGFETINYEYPFKNKSNGKNVILIISDALRADNLPFYGYDRNTSPFLSKLYDSGKLQKIEYATSSCTSSFCGILSILSSVEAINLNLVNYNLFDVLKTQGYTNYFLTSGVFYGFYKLRARLGNNIDYSKEAKDMKGYEMNDDNSIIDQLQKITKDELKTPAFFYLHLMSTHPVGIRLPNPPYSPSKFGQHLSFSERVKGYTNYYDNGICTADEIIYQIFDLLSKDGLLENCLVIISADHGEELGERGKFAHSQAPYRDQIKIPLLIYDSDSVAYKNTFYASQIDIGPTIVDRIGIPKPEPWQGNSLYSVPFKSRLTIHDSARDIALLQVEEDSSMKKIIYQKEKKTFEFFDLIKDPYELEKKEISKYWQDFFEDNIQIEK